MKKEALHHKRPKGLKWCHIGDGVWKFGKQSYTKDKGLHMVITGPDRKQYHLWNREVSFCVQPREEDHPPYPINRHGNTADEALVKCYIMTYILDSPVNWEWNLNKKPSNGRTKVIYKNGTVRWIEFNGEWEPIVKGYKTYDVFAWRKW